MATVTQLMTMARAFIKVEATYASAEEVRIANYINSLVINYHRWHWNTAAGTNVALALNTQGYTMAAGDQDLVQAIQNAYLTDASVTYAPLAVESNLTLPVTAATGRPYVVGMTSSTTLRFFPTPDGTYTFIWRYYKRPTIFTLNTQAFDVPGSFDPVIKTGIIWQLLSYRDDARAPEYSQLFYAQLGELKLVERFGINRTR